MYKIFFINLPFYKLSRKMEALYLLYKYKTSFFYKKLHFTINNIIFVEKETKIIYTFLIYYNKGNANMATLDVTIILSKISFN